MTPHSSPRLDVLVVDDDPFIRESIQLFLESEGLSVRVASGGKEGIELLHEAEPDVALVDLRMPRINGLDVLREFIISEHGALDPTIIAAFIRILDH
jgi:CheY-like chemotaxis protein